ncbi:hypothetical protein F1189_28885, partial [Rhodovastum atsumiense]
METGETVDDRRVLRTMQGHVMDERCSSQLMDTDDKEVVPGCGVAPVPPRKLRDAITCAFWLVDNVAPRQGKRRGASVAAPNGIYTESSRAVVADVLRDVFLKGGDSYLAAAQAELRALGYKGQLAENCLSGIALEFALHAETTAVAFDAPVPAWATAILDARLGVSKGDSTHGRRLAGEPLRKASDASKAVMEPADVGAAQVAAVAEPVVEPADAGAAEVSAVAEPAVESAEAGDAEVAAVAEPAVEPVDAGDAEVSAVAEPAVEPVDAGDVEVAAVAEPVVEPVDAAAAEVSAVAEPVAEPVDAGAAEVSAVAEPAVEPAEAGDAEVAAVAEPVVEPAEAGAAEVAAVAEPVVEPAEAGDAEVAAVAEPAVEPAEAGAAEVSAVAEPAVEPVDAGAAEVSA